ncbi:Spermidine synthase [Thelohanellus kitauei]|uniref:Spermidine synthase n=1 Tax=Thelohanellus kitauei TaxID=669202 RepID=A0A0C2MRQ2_THEKT|nr:Spermidine synthase [Thelohanellus kitauei]
MSYKDDGFSFSTDSTKVEKEYYFEKDIFQMAHRQGIKVKEVLFHGTSPYQDVWVFSTEKYGNVLVLDGAFQCTEWDEFVYQEMLTYLPVNSHPKPSNVLVIGGGDGGVLRQLDIHPSVDKAVLCEIDQMVMDVSKKYLTGMAKGLNSSKATIIVKDAFEYLETTKEKFDVIIMDTTDPDGSVSESLYTEKSLLNMSRCLNDGGVICLQSECVWHSLELISSLVETCQKYFKTVKYATSNTPMYPFGQMGYLLLSKETDYKFEEPKFKMDPKKYGLKYYTPEIHKASFVLPPFVEEAIYKKKD